MQFTKTLARVPFTLKQSSLISFLIKKNNPAANFSALKAQNWNLLKTHLRAEQPTREKLQIYAGADNCFDKFVSGSTFHPRRNYLSLRDEITLREREKARRLHINKQTQNIRSSHYVSPRRRAGRTNGSSAVCPI
jgi:hypothetical protein